MESRQLPLLLLQEIHPKFHRLMPCFDRKNNWQLESRNRNRLLFCCNGLHILTPHLLDLGLSLRRQTDFARKSGQCRLRLHSITWTCVCSTTFPYQEPSPSPSHFGFWRTVHLVRTLRIESAVLFFFCLLRTVVTMPNDSITHPVFHSFCHRVKSPCTSNRLQYQTLGRSDNREKSTRSHRRRTVWSVAMVVENPTCLMPYNLCCWVLVLPLSDR